MSRLVIAFLSALAATAAYAQNIRTEQSQPPAAAGANEMRPFLFDGRMKGDGDRHRVLVDDHHPNAGAVIMPPKTDRPAHEQ